MTTCFGVTRNPLAPNVPNALTSACRRLGVPFRTIELASLATTISGELTVYDSDGIVSVDFISPTLFYWQEQATVALDVLWGQGCRMLNTVAACLTADDKAATAMALTKAEVAQVATTAVASDFGRVKAAAQRYGYPVVIKRTRGGQGRWVRLAHDGTELKRATAELQEEGPGMILVQPVGAKRLGESLRVIVTAGAVRAATVRHAVGPEWRSNISAGGTQTPAELSAAEGDLALAAADAVGLGHAGVDLLRSAAGPVVLEVNSCPDFTSMTPYVKDDLAAIVIEQTLQLGALSCGGGQPAWVPYSTDQMSAGSASVAAGLGHEARLSGCWTASLPATRSRLALVSGQAREFGSRRGWPAHQSH